MSPTINGYDLCLTNLQRYLIKYSSVLSGFELTSVAVENTVNHSLKWMTCNPKKFSKAFISCQINVM